MLTTKFLMRVKPHTSVNYLSKIKIDLKYNIIDCCIIFALTNILSLVSGYSIFWHVAFIAQYKKDIF